MVKEISLTQGKAALVDDENFEELNKYKWFAKKDLNTFYAARHGKWGFGKRQEIKMHGFIMNTPAGMKTDHINGDGLDNRRDNLRVCTHSENHMNRSLPKNNTTGYKGVSRCADSKKNPFQAQIKKDKKVTYLGLFPTAEDAARAYDKAAKELFGEFARLNFP